jgi:hypothetical protein
MPRAARWLVRTSLVYLALGFTLGAVLLFNKGVPLLPGIHRLLPAHIEFLLVGWVIQLVMGVATWIFPRFGVPHSAHGSEVASWLAFALLNGGVWLVGAGALLPGGGGEVLPLLARVGEATGAIVFALNIWPRVRASGLSPM